MNKSDASYRMLLNSPRLVGDLFNGIIKEPWISLVDWQSLQALPTDYISDRLRQRQGDRVWRVARRDGVDLYLLLMLEHQSKNERLMALRMATYCALLYESLAQRKALPRSRRLPLVLPVVLYSGAKPWAAATSTTGLIDKAPPALAPYTLQLRYLLVDEGALVRAGKLPEHNLAALLFRLEHNRGIEDVQNLVQTIWNATHGPEHAELRRAFVSWTRHVLLPRALPEVMIPGVDDLLEIKDMLTEHSRSWTHQWKMEGREEGRKAGLQEGEAALLQRLLIRKFGPLPQPIQQRLQGATSAQLETWSLNILDATSLDEVFDR
ncbi:MAG TPA: Rpn family recombination-promoting nuclease/putative transposase [Eoetvoesiella sp.]